MEVPLLLITFNRFDNFQILIDSLKKVRPTKIYLFSDGSRLNNEVDSYNIDKLRSEYQNLINWQCQIFTKFENENLGCKYGPINAISWLFEMEDSGIILEDDCIPSPTFFRFANYYLELYKEDLSIFSISGTNICPDNITANKTYSSIYHLPWGWATWKRSWNLFDYEGHFLNTKEFKLKFSKQNLLFRYIWKKNINYFSDGTHHMWDPQWNLYCLFKGGRSIYPGFNLIENIGHDSRATHTINQNSMFNKLNINFDQDVSILFNNPDLENTLPYDKYIGQKWWSITLTTLLKDIVRKFIKY